MRAKKDNDLVSRAVENSNLPTLSIWESFQRIGGSLTPTDVSRILREADDGDPRRFVDLLNETRQKDGHIQSVLFTREAAIAGLPWRVRMPGKQKRPKPGSRPRGAPVLRFVEEVLQRPELDITTLVMHLAGSITAGYAVAETIETTDSRGRIVPESFKLHSPRRFGFRSEDCKLVAFAKNTRDEIDFQAKWPERFMIAQPRITGDIPAREGLGRLVAWLGLFRNWDVTDWIKLGEIAWKPYRRGKIKAGASEKDVANLIKILQQLTTTGVAAYPEAMMDVEVDWPTGGTSARGGSHAELFEVLGRELSKAVLGQTLTTEQGKVGSQALGNVHDRVRRDILEFDAKFIARVITRYLIAPMVRRNFGENAIVPIFEFITDDSADFASFMKGVKDGKEAGLRIPAPWVRDKVGMPEPEEDEEIVGADAEAANDEEPAKDEPADAEEEDEGVAAE